MSRLTPEQMAYTLNEARERLSRHRGAFVDLADRHAAALLDLVEERDAARRAATQAQSVAATASRNFAAVDRERDALAARVHGLEAEHLVWVKRAHDAEDEALRVREES